MKYLASIFLLIPVISFCQDNLTGQAANKNLDDLVKSGIGLAFDDRYDGVKGSPFVYDTWVDAVLTMKNKVSFPIKGKLNLYDEVVLYYSENLQSAMELENRMITSIKFKNDTIDRTFINFGMKVSNPVLDNSKDHGFFEILYEGDLSLYVKRRKKFMKANYTGAYSAGKTQDEFYDDIEYYVRKKDQPLEITKLKKKSILELMSDQKELIEAFIKTNKLDFKVESDIASLFQYYDSLR